MESFVAVDDAGNRVPVQVVRSGDNLVIFLNEGQSIEGVTSALQGMADGSGGGQDQYQIMVTDNYVEGQQLEGVQQVEGFQQIEDGAAVQDVQPVIGMEPEQTFSTETYQQYQVDHMVQDVQSVSVQPVSESGEAVDAFVPAVARGSEAETVSSLVSTIESGTESEGVTAFVSTVASGSESEGVNAFVSAVASGFQEPGSGGQQLSNLPNVNIPIDSNFAFPVSQYEQSNYVSAESSVVATNANEGHFEQTSLATVESGVGTTQIATEQFTQATTTTDEGTVESSSDVGQYSQDSVATADGVGTAEVTGGHLEIDLARKPIDVVTDISDLIVQPLPTDTTSTVQTQIDKPYIATKVEIPRAFPVKTNVGSTMVSQKTVTQTAYSPVTMSKTPTSKAQGVSILLKCEKCDQVFFTASDLKLHREKVHGARQDVGKLPSIVVEKKQNGEGDAGRNLCSICHIICPSLQALIKHKHEKHGMDMPFKCDFCSYSATQKKYLDIHMKTHQKVYKCNICQNKFESQDKLEKHVASHSRDKYQCFYCSKMYLTRKACTDHIALKHSGPQKDVQFVETKKEVKPTPAPPAATVSAPDTTASTAQPTAETSQSGSQTDFVDSLIEGEEAKTEENLLQDNLDQLADIAAAQAGELTGDSKEKEAEQEKSSQPNPAYTEEQEMAVDTINNDTTMDIDEGPDSTKEDAENGETEADVKSGNGTQMDPRSAPEGLEDYTPIKNKDFQCLGCNAQFATEILFQNHFLREHSDENMCLVCGRDFAKKYLLRVHFHETHCCKDVYKCKSCGKVFNMVSKYWQHAQLHARRHVCKMCDRAFTTSTEVKRHEMTVHLNKSYFCVYCPETFTSAADLRKHKEDAHNMKPYKKTKDIDAAKPKPDAKKEITAVTNSGAKNLIQQAKESGTQMTIKIFRDGTYMTTDPNTGNTDYGTIDLANLGLDPSLLQKHNDLELVIIPPDKEEELTTQKKTATSPSDNTKEKAHDMVKNAASPVKANEPLSKVKGTFAVEKTVSPESEIVYRKQVVPEGRSFSCSFCPRTFRFYRHLRCHESAHGRDEKYVCHICQRMFVRETNLQLHLELHKKKDLKSPPPTSRKTPSNTKPKNDMEVACDTCGKVFGNKSKLNRHLKDTHHAEPIVCQICNRSFRNESNAQRHMKQHYGPFPCAYCSEIFKDKEVLNDHVKETHQIKLHTCHVCGKEMFSFGKLLSHLKIVHPDDEEALKEVKDSLKCDICQKKFTSAKTVRLHKLTHTGEKKYQCPHCPWKFYLSWKLRKHIKVHEKSPGDKNRFPCDMCTKDFFSQNALEKHESVQHAGPFQCQLCKAKKFKDKEMLKEHGEEKHSGNCFKCEMCDLPFSSGRYLQIHQLNSHLKKHLCDLCGYAFTRKDEMLEHLKFNHFDGDEEKFRAAYPSVDTTIQQTDFEELRRTLKCPRCKKVFKKFNGLMGHMKSCDKDVKEDEEIPMDEESSAKSEESTPIDKKALRRNPTCPNCSKKFQSLAAVVSHMRFCKAKTMKLPVKVKSYSPSKVKKEAEDEVSDEKDYVPFTYLETGKYVRCDKCHKTFSKRESLKKHMLVHAGISKKTEAVKNKASKLDTSAQPIGGEKKSDKSSKSVGGKTGKFFDVSKRKCEKCKITFTCLFSLKRHLYKRHPESGVRMDTKLVKGSIDKAKTKNTEPIMTPKTEEEITQLAKNQFLQMNFALGIKTEPSSDLTSPVVETVKTKRHDCNLCGLKFSREATLKKHLVEVHDEEDFEEPQSDSSEDSVESEEIPVSPVKTRRMSKVDMSTPKLKTESEESTPKSSGKSRFKKAGKSSTQKTDASATKVKKEIQENEIKHKLKRRRESTDQKQIKIETRAMLKERVDFKAKKKSGKKEVFNCKHCDKTFEAKVGLDRHLRYNHKDAKAMLSSLNTLQNLRGKKAFYNLRVKKKIAGFQKSNPKKTSGLDKSGKVKAKDVQVKSEPLTVTDMRKKIRSKADILKVSKPKHPIRPQITSKARSAMLQSKKHNKSPNQASKQLNVSKAIFAKKPKKKAGTSALEGFFSQFLKKRLSMILFECEFCDQQFSDKIKLNFHRRTKHSSKVVSKSICECSVCQETFTELRIFLSHMASAHKIQSEEKSEITAEGIKKDTPESPEKTGSMDVSGEVKVNSLNEDDKADDISKIHLEDTKVSELAGSTQQTARYLQNMSEAFVLDNDLTSQYIELQNSKGHKDATDVGMEKRDHMEVANKGGLAMKAEESSIMDSGNTFDANMSGAVEKVTVKKDTAETSQNLYEKAGPFIQTSEHQHEMGNNQAATSMMENAEVKFLGDDREVEALTEGSEYPVVHDVDMFTGTILNDGKDITRTETPIESFIEGTDRLSTKSGTPVLKVKSMSKEKIGSSTTDQASVKQCLVCLKTFITEEGFRKHIHTHTKKKYECPKCDAFFRWEKNLKSHVQLFHSDSEVLVCRECSKIFYQKEALEKHHIIHLAKKFPCTECKKKFSNHSVLKSHITEVHKNSVMPLKKKSGVEMTCSACKLKFGSMDTLMNHMLLDHSARKPAKIVFREKMYKYRCKFCPLMFKTKDSQESHLKVCDKRTLLVKKLYGQELTDNTCLICGLKFKSKTRTFKHMQIVHGQGSKFHHIDFLKHPTVQNKYSCENCNGTFAKFASYSMHEKSLYGICSKKKKSSKYERCPFCKVLFASRLILGKHMVKVHNNFLYYSWKHCPYCEQSFARRLNLKKHLQAVHPQKLNESKKSAKVESKKSIKAEGKSFKSEGKKIAKKSHTASAAIEQIVKNVVSKQKAAGDSTTKEITELENKYRKIRQSTGIERHKCEYCGRVSWTVGSYEEHLSRYHGDRWIEKSVNSPGIASSPTTIDANEMVGTASADDSKLAAVPVVMIQRLPVDLLIKSSENAASEEKRSSDKYLGVPYSFSDEIKKEDPEPSEMKEEDLGHIEGFPDLPLEQSGACKSEVNADTVENEIHKEVVEDYLKPANSVKILSDTIGIPESLPDEILAASDPKSVGNLVKSEPTYKDFPIESDGSKTLNRDERESQTRALEELIMPEEVTQSKQVSVEKEIATDAVHLEVKTDVDSAVADLMSENVNIADQNKEIMGETKTETDSTNFEVQFESQVISENNGTRAVTVIETRTGLTADTSEEVLEYQEMEVDEMQMEEITSNQSPSDGAGTREVQGENLIGDIYANM